MGYDPSEPRDDQGRWTDSGGGSSSGHLGSAVGHNAGVGDSGVALHISEQHRMETRGEAFRRGASTGASIGFFAGGVVGGRIGGGPGALAGALAGSAQGALIGGVVGLATRKQLIRQYIETQHEYAVRTGSS